MSDALLIAVVALLLLGGVLLLVLVLRRPPDLAGALRELSDRHELALREQSDRHASALHEQSDRQVAALQDFAARQAGAQQEFASRQASAAADASRALREELTAQSRQDRGEATASVARLGEALAQQMGTIASVQNAQIDAFAQQLTRLTESNDQRLAALREAVQADARAIRDAVVEDARGAREAGREEARLAREAGREDARLAREELAATLARFGEALQASLAQLSGANEQRLAEVRATLENKLRELQTDNAAKLEEMRRTVDEKLHATLEQRLGESFRLVSDRLDAVHKGLGEMQVLASDVGDLKRVLTNVKTRGVWGEVQLAALLEQMLVPGQYATNVATIPGSAERVEFAIRLPGRGGETPVWLPIDAKFPREDYERLMLAHEAADAAGAETASRQLEQRLRAEAKSIRDKYVGPPHTTDFALMFLPVEGLYAEAVRRPGLVDDLQRVHRVVIAGPTTLAAILSSLQMGFRTLAVEQRSSEVWQLLGAVKTEFGRFGDVLAKARRQLEQASSTLGTTETRTRVIERKLRDVQSLPESAARGLLGEGRASDGPAGSEDGAGREDGVSPGVDSAGARDPDGGAGPGDPGDVGTSQG